MTTTIPTNGDALETDAEVYAAIEAKPKRTRKSKAAPVTTVETTDTDADDAFEDYLSEVEHLDGPVDPEQLDELRAVWEETQDDEEGPQGPDSDHERRDESGRLLEPEGGDFRPGYHHDGTPKAKRARRQSAPKVETKEPRPCECQCGGFVVGKKARFKVGHDAKLKGALLKYARGGSSVAIAELDRLGWAHFLVETKATRRAAKVAA